jgi:hypothetical protein
MTELQDLILDRLVGTRVGVHWPDGPLAIAAEVVGGKKPVKFGQTDNDRGAKSEIARRLGYPVLLCEAIQGANRGLAAEDDRRSLAMNVFRTISIGGKVPKLSARAQNEVAARLAIRAHAYACPAADCPVPQVLAGLLEESGLSWQAAVNAAGARCVALGGRLVDHGSSWLTARSTRETRLAQTALMVIRGFQSGMSVHGWCSIRESARLAASERGVAEAVECCVEIARRCGMGV